MTPEWKSPEWLISSTGGPGISSRGGCPLVGRLGPMATRRAGIRDIVAGLGLLGNAMANWLVVTGTMEF